MFPRQTSTSGFFPGYRDPTVRVPALTPAPSVDELVRGHATLTPRATIVATGQVLPVSDWSVDVQAGQPVTRTLSLTVSDAATWAPRFHTSPLDPSSLTEVRMELGIGSPRTRTTWVTIGMFTITGTSIRHTEAGQTLSLEGLDRAVLIRQLRMVAGVTIDAGTSAEAAMAALLNPVSTGVPLLLCRSGYYLPESVIGSPGADPWEEARKVAAAAGCTLTITADGSAVMRQVRDARLTLPSRTWWAETHDVITSISRDLDGAELPTGIIVPYGDSSDVAVVPEGTEHRRRILYDGDTTLLTTKADAIRAGSAQLLTRMGAVETISVEVLTDPRCDVGDVVQISHAAIGVSVIARITGISLRPGPTMSVRLAERRYS